LIKDIGQSSLIEQLQNGPWKIFPDCQGFTPELEHQPDANKQYIKLEFNVRLLNEKTLLSTTQIVIAMDPTLDPKNRSVLRSICKKGIESVLNCPLQNSKTFTCKRWRKKARKMTAY